MLERRDQPSDAALLAVIARCHNAVLPGDRLPLHIGDQLIGYVKPDLAAALENFATPSASGLSIAPADAPHLNEIAKTLAPRFGFRIRHENFDVRADRDGPALTTLDRGALPAFGVVGVGVHLNGYVRRADGIHLWIAKRSPTKKLDPDKLDNLVGGGVSAGMTPFETLIKEAAEEATLPEPLLNQAIRVARIAYHMDRPEGLRRDILYCYDLELPEHFIPQPADGEVASFTLMPASALPTIIAAGEAIKFNVNLVLIDFLLRHHILNDSNGRLSAALSKQEESSSFL